MISRLKMSIFRVLNGRVITLCLFQEVFISLFQLSDVPEEGMLQVRMSVGILC